MLPPTARPRSLSLGSSSTDVLRSTPALSALILSSNGTTLAASPNPYRRHARGFWWGRHRVWTSYLDQSFEKHLRKRNRVLKHKLAHALHRKSLWDREHAPHDLYHRFMSSWGGGGGNKNGRWLDADRLSEKNADADERAEWRPFDSRSERWERKIQAMRRHIEEDPYGALFGSSWERMQAQPSASAAASSWSSFGWGWGGSAAEDTAAESKSSTSAQEKSPKTSTQKQSVSGASSSSSDQATAVSNSGPLYTSHAEGEYTYDPITMRRVPKASLVDKAEDAAGIPVKTFDQTVSEDKQDALERALSRYQTEPLNSENPPPIQQTPDPVASALQAFEQKDLSKPSSHGRDWLDREGFGAARARTESFVPVENMHEALEEASVGSSVKTTKLSYPPEDLKEDDLDILTASDVRANSGKLKHPRKESDAEKQTRRDELETDFAKGLAMRLDPDEIAAQTVKSKSYPKPVDAEDGYDTTPQGLETSFFEEQAQKAVEEPTTDAHGYDKTPMGLEVSYAKELEKRVQGLEHSFTQEMQDLEAARQAAELDGFDKTPQGLEISFQKEQERNANALEYSYAAEMEAKEQNASLHDDPADKTPQGLEVSFEKERQQQAEALKSSYDSETNSYKTAMDQAEVDHFGYSTKPQGLETSYARETAEGDLAANVAQFAYPDRWYKQKAPHATLKEDQKFRDSALVREIRGIYEDEYGIIDTAHRQGASKIANDNGPDIYVTEGLAAHDEKIGPEAYKFTTGQHDLEAEILAQNETLVPESSSTSTVQSSDEAAMRLEEAEQILHEEVRESSDLLHSVRSELSDLAAPSPGEASTPTIYKVLAYDPATQEITTAITTSSTSFPSESPMAPSEAISKLTTPARFLPYFDTLKDEGYEILSGSGDVLVFKQMRAPTADTAASTSTNIPAPEPSTKSGWRRPINPIDGTSFPTPAANYASPTGFVSYNNVWADVFTDQPQPAASSANANANAAAAVPAPDTPVRRAEPVFSGSRRWNDGNRSGTQDAGRAKGGRKTLRRALWVGVWVAGCSYAVGVVAEFFRTGGVDGTGVQGF